MSAPQKSVAIIGAGPVGPGAFLLDEAPDSHRVPRI
jgi:hypothetical protein